MPWRFGRSPYGSGRNWEPRTKRLRPFLQNKRAKDRRREEKELGFGISGSRKGQRSRELSAFNGAEGSRKERRRH